MLLQVGLGDKVGQRRSHLCNSFTGSDHSLAPKEQAFYDEFLASRSKDKRKEYAINTIVAGLCLGIIPLFMYLSRMSLGTTVYRLKESINPSTVRDTQDALERKLMRHDISCFTDKLDKLVHTVNLTQDTLLDLWKNNKLSVKEISPKLTKKNIQTKKLQELVTETNLQLNEICKKKGLSEKAFVGLYKKDLSVGQVAKLYDKGLFTILREVLIKDYFAKSSKENASILKDKYSYSPSVSKDAKKIFLRFLRKYEKVLNLTKEISDNQSQKEKDFYEKIKKYYKEINQFKVDYYEEIKQAIQEQKLKKSKKPLC